MDASLLIWFVCAVLLFWCVGLYQRLLRLRLAAQQALGALEQPLAAYHTLLSQYFAHDWLTGPLPDDWLRLVEAVKALAVHIQAVRNAPFSAEPLSALAAQIDALSVAWAPLLAHPADLAGAAMPAELGAQWQQADFSVQLARAQLNQTMDAYNEALQQFPANTVVRLMGFKQLPKL
jgi:LemA protein